MGNWEEPTCLIKNEMTTTVQVKEADKRKNNRASLQGKSLSILAFYRVEGGHIIVLLQHWKVFLNMSINLMTYEAQFFGFTPQTFMLRIYFAFQDHLSHIMLVVEKVILNKLESICPSLTPTLIRRSTEKFFAFMKERFDNLFTKMEEPLLNTVLSIPKNICLPEDKLQEEFCYTAKQFQELENEISQLERELKAETCAEQALKTELEEQKVVQGHLEGILQWFDGLDNIGRNEGTGNLKESFAALTKTATKLHNIVQEVEGKMNRLRK